MPDWAAIPSAFVLTILLTPLVARQARRVGAVARPRPDRWHTRPTALLGGIAIFLAVVITQLGFGLLRPDDIGWFMGWVIMFVLGLVDDLRRIRPSIKLSGQVLAAGVVLVAGSRLSWTGIEVIDCVLTAFWLIGITNALNLIDNMDGLAAGVGAIAAVCFALQFMVAGQTGPALNAAILAAALVGFLIYNFNPASIFMGDSGSQFIGFYLACTALSFPTVVGEYRVAHIVVPILILAAPIFDTSFVTVTRLREGRPISQGGRDHTSHRLVARGCSEASAVGVMYAVGAFIGLLALLVLRLNPLGALMSATGVGVALIFFGVWLGRSPKNDAKTI